MSVCECMGRGEEDGLTYVCSWFIIPPSPSIHSSFCFPTPNSKDWLVSLGSKLQAGLEGALLFGSSLLPQLQTPSV